MPTTKLPTGLAPAEQLAQKRKPPFPGESEAYSQAREKLLAEEIEFRRHMTRLTEQRRALPLGPVIRTNYRFKLADGRLVRDNLETLYGAIDDGALDVRLPKHAKKELEAFLDCGLLCRGFARLRCPGCDESRLVAYSPPRSICASGC
jgi:hypothetical protein